MNYVVFTALFMISLGTLYFLDKQIFDRFKILLIISFVLINAILMIGLSFSDAPILGIFYNGVISVLIVLPNIVSLFLKQKN